MTHHDLSEDLHSVEVALNALSDPSLLGRKDGDDIALLLAQTARDSFARVQSALIFSPGMAIKNVAETENRVDDG